MTNSPKPKDSRFPVLENKKAVNPHNGEAETKECLRVSADK